MNKEQLIADIKAMTVLELSELVCQTVVLQASQISGFAARRILHPARLSAQTEIAAPAAYH